VKKLPKPDASGVAPLMAQEGPIRSIYGPQDRPHGREMGAAIRLSQRVVPKPGCVGALFNPWRPPAPLPSPAPNV